MHKLFNHFTMLIISVWRIIIVKNNVLMNLSYKYTMLIIHSYDILCVRVHQLEIKYFVKKNVIVIIDVAM